MIDFERGERAEGERAHQWGTVFQTALPYLLNTRDFVPGYSRYARYWLPAKSTFYTTKPQNNKTTKQLISLEHSTKQVIIRENPSARQAHTNPKERNP